MDQELRTYLDTRFDAIDNRFDRLERKVDQTLDLVQAIADGHAKRFDSPGSSCGTSRGTHA